MNNETNINIFNNNNVVENSRVNDYFKSTILDGVEFSSGIWGDIISMETSNTPVYSSGFQDFYFHNVEFPSDIWGDPPLNY